MEHIRLTLGAFQGQITRTRSICEGLWCELWESWVQWVVMGRTEGDEAQQELEPSHKSSIRLY